MKFVCENQKKISFCISYWYISQCLYCEKLSYWDVVYAVCSYPTHRSVPWTQVTRLPVQRASVYWRRPWLRHAPHRALRQYHAGLRHLSLTTSLIITLSWTPFRTTSSMKACCKMVSDIDVVKLLFNFVTANFKGALKFVCVVPRFIQCWFVDFAWEWLKTDSVVSYIEC